MEKNKSITEGLHIEARTHLQHWDLMLRFVFSFQSHGEKTIHQKGRTEADAEPAAHGGEHGAGGTLLEQEGKRPAWSAGGRGVLWGAPELQRCQAGCLRSGTLPKPLFYCC